jgi:succinate dehydrogenase flavin-adding protein (antitoxin of CptAB toxin-antitoxin module)
MTNDLNSNRNITSDNAALRNNERKAKKEGMKKGIMTTAIIALLLLVGAALVVNSKFKDEQKKNVSIVENQKRSYTQLLTSRDSVLNEWMMTFNEIEKDLATIKEKEKIISVKSNDSEFTKDRKQAILKDIEYVNTLLDQNKKKIASLTAQLKNQGGTIKGLQVKIAELEASMKQRETEVNDLKVALTQKDFEIGQLNTRMTDAQIAIAQKDETISVQTAEMNKGFVAYGTYKDLKAKGLVSKEGGFLGIGKKEQLHQDFSDSLFTQVNITETKSIPVNSKAAKLITDHPTTSYELVRGDDDKITSIEIKDPEEFWKISKYAVVEIK